MAMFRAFFDASGHPDTTGKAPALFVSGFVASIQKWAEFDRLWLDLLASYDLTPPFHMTDFEAGRGQYTALRQDTHAYWAFKSAAIEIMTRNTNKAISVGVVIPALRRVFDEYEVPSEFSRNPYPWCGIQVVEQVVRWAGNRLKAGSAKPSDQVQIIFQDGDKDRGELARRVERMYKQAPLFWKTKQATAFQACDFMAWEHRNWLTIHGTRILPKPRHSVIELARRIAFDSQLYADWKTMRRSAEEQRWPKRVQPTSG